MLLESEEGALSTIPPSQGWWQQLQLQGLVSLGCWSKGEVSGLCCWEGCQQLEADKLLLGTKTRL